MCYNKIMDEVDRFVTGLDVGTENVRAVIATVGKDGKISIVGYSEGESAGMRKGSPANLSGPAGAIDRMLASAEQMGGYDVRSAYVSINGSQILTTNTEGMIVVGNSEHEIVGVDLDRVEDVAVSGSIPPNREVLDVVPLEYALDGQGGIKDPLGMSGSRLEIRANVISAPTPNCNILKRATESAEVQALRLVPTAVAAAMAVLTEKQMENGAAVVDLGAATTSIAVYEEGDLQYAGVIPIGSNNITNDLAIVLAIEPEMAEEIKTRFITGEFGNEKSPVIKIKREGKAERNFDRKEVEEVVEARLTEIFAEVRKRLKMAHYDQRLPEGVILTGGGAKMRKIEVFAKEALEAAVKVGVPGGFSASSATGVGGGSVGASGGIGGVIEEVQKPEFAVSVGLALIAASESHMTAVATKKGLKKAKKGVVLGGSSGVSGSSKGGGAGGLVGAVKGLIGGVKGIFAKF